MARWLLLALSLFTLDAQPAAAQDVAGLTFAAVGIGWVVLGAASIARLNERGTRVVPGDTIRFVAEPRADFAHGRSAVRGTLVSVSRDSLVVATAEGTETYALGDANHVGVLVGQESKWAQGWLTGFLVGGVGLAALGEFAGGPNHPCDDFCFTKEQSALLGLIVGGFTGSMIGAGVGAAMKGDHWMHARNIQGRRLTVAPVVGRSTGVQVRMAF